MSHASCKHKLCSIILSIFSLDANVPHLPFDLFCGTFIFVSINPLNKKPFNSVIWSITYAFSGLSKYLTLLLKDLNYAILVLGSLPNRTEIELQLHNKQELLIANFVDFFFYKKRNNTSKCVLMELFPLYSSCFW